MYIPPYQTPNPIPIPILVPVAQTVTEKDPSLTLPYPPFPFHFPLGPSLLLAGTSTVTRSASNDEEKKRTVGTIQVEKNLKARDMFPLWYLTLPTGTRTRTRPRTRTRARTRPSTRTRTRTLLTSPPPLCMGALRRRSSSIRVACEPFPAIAAHERTRTRTRTRNPSRYPSIVPGVAPLAAPRPSPPIRVPLLSISLSLSLSLPLAARHADTPHVGRPASSRRQRAADALVLHHHDHPDAHAIVRAEERRAGDPSRSTAFFGGVGKRVVRVVGVRGLVWIFSVVMVRAALVVNVRGSGAR